MAWYNVGPPSYKLVNITPSNYGEITTINPSEIVVIIQVNAILGAPHCNHSANFPTGIFLGGYRMYRECKDIGKTIGKTFSENQWETIGKSWFCMGFEGIYPLVSSNMACLKMDHRNR